MRMSGIGNQQTQNGKMNSKAMKSSPSSWGLLGMPAVPLRHGWSEQEGCAGELLNLPSNEEDIRREIWSRKEGLNSQDLLIVVAYNAWKFYSWLGFPAMLYR